MNGLSIGFKSIFLFEKSPPNIINTIYLQEIVHNSYFIIIIRHPFAVGIATKWNNQILDKIYKSLVTSPCNL